MPVMIVVLFVALIALAGLVVDGGAKLAAYQNAEALAQEAARAGATTVDTSEAYRAGTFVVAPGFRASGEPVVFRRLPDGRVVGLLFGGGSFVRLDPVA